MDRLNAAWSPEQIAGRLRHDAEPTRQVCHETIYRFIYGPEGLARELHKLLPSRRKRRRPRAARRPRGYKIPESNTVARRPSEINARTSFGHWECDLVAFRLEYGKSNIRSLVERTSRYSFLSRNPSRQSAGVMAGLLRDLGSLPTSARQTITFDRGTEFAGYTTLKQKAGIESYFCAPQAPWQKGTVENTNGRLRRFLPLDTDIAQIAEDDLPAITAGMNATPRKCLGFRTPEEAFLEHLARAEAAHEKR